MNNIIISVVLLAIWLRLRVERRCSHTEWNIEYLSMSAELRERICQAESRAEAAESLQNSRGATIQRRNEYIELQNKRIAKTERKCSALKGQITKLKKKIGGEK